MQQREVQHEQHLEQVTSRLQHEQAQVLRKTEARAEQELRELRKAKALEAQKLTEARDNAEAAAEVGPLPAALPHPNHLRDKARAHPLRDPLTWQELERRLAEYEADAHRTGEAHRGGEMVDRRTVRGEHASESGMTRPERSNDACRDREHRSSVDRSSVDRSSVDRSSGDRSNVDRSSGDRSSGDRSSVDRSSGDRSSGDRSSGDRSSVDRSSGDRSSVDRSSGDRSSGDRSSGDRSSGDRSSVDRSSVDRSSVDRSSMDRSLSNTSCHKREDPKDDVLRDDELWDHASYDERDECRSHRDAHKSRQDDARLGRGDAQRNGGEAGVARAGVARAGQEMLGSEDVDTDRHASLPAKQKLESPQVSPGPVSNSSPVQNKHRHCGIQTKALSSTIRFHSFLAGGTREIERGATTDARGPARSRPTSETEGA